MLLRNYSEVYKKGLLSMSDLYKRIEDLCKENNITITTMCKNSGASRASLSDLKMGRKQNLSIKTLKSIADYFGVTVDYLSGYVSEPYFKLDNTGIVSDLNSRVDEEKAPAGDDKRTVTDDDIQFALFGGNDEITESMYEEVKKFAAYLKQREGYNK